MNPEPLVSVLTPCYNHHKFLDDYFHSLLDQSYQNIELIIIDDCSTDGSWDKILSYETRLRSVFTNVVLQKNSKNLGLIPTLAQLKQLINGDFVAILESDDYYKPDMLASCVDFLLRNPDMGAVHSEVDFLYPDRIEQDHWTSLGRRIRQGDVYKQLLVDNFILTCTFCCCSNLFLQHANFDKYIQRGYLTADYPIFLDLARHTKFGYIERSLAVYRVVPDSISHPHDILKTLSWKEAYYRVKLDYIQEYGASSPVRARAEKQYNRTLYETGLATYNTVLFYQGYQWLVDHHPKEFNRLPYYLRRFTMLNRSLWKIYTSIERAWKNHQL